MTRPETIFPNALAPRRGRRAVHARVLGTSAVDPSTPRRSAPALAATLAAVLVIGCGSSNPSSAAAGMDATVDGSPDALDAARADVPSVCASDARPDYPAGPYGLADDSTLPDLRFVTGSGSELRLGQYYAPCAATPRLLII